MLVVILEVYRRLSEQTARLRESVSDTYRNQGHSALDHYRQFESLFSLFSILKPVLPLPDMRGWAASPDLLKTITEVILIEKPRLVVELGSGVSTVVIGYCMKQLGKGKAVSLEHDVKYAAISQRVISTHGLDDIVTVVHAPLKTFIINDEKWPWYTTDCLLMCNPVDLLVIDGPPGHCKKLSRYPALPLLHGQLNNRATIILDDGHREDEKEIVALWEAEFKDIRAEFLEVEKGAYLLHKRTKREKE